MRDDERSFLNGIDKAINLQDPMAIQDLVSDFSEFCFKDSPDIIYEDTRLSSDFIVNLVGITKEPKLLVMDGSYYLFAFFQNDWGRFTAEQKKTILELLGYVYGNLKDSTSCLIISEIFGDYVGGEQGLRYLTNSLSANNEACRAYVAHGLKLLAENTNKESIKLKATKALIDMTSDRSELVRREAKNNLSKIG